MDRKLPLCRGRQADLPGALAILRLMSLEASLLWSSALSRTASGGRAAAALRAVLDKAEDQSSNLTKGLRLARIAADARGDTVVVPNIRSLEQGR